MDREQVAARWELVLPHRPALVRVARSRGLATADAEECAQEAMLRCVEFARLDEARVLAFLVTTTIRLCADRGRQYARDQRLAQRLTTWDAAEPSPEDAACDRAEAEWLAAELADLPDTQRRVLAARADGLDHTEVARRFAVSYKTVESQLYRVRVRARALLAGTAGALVAFLRRPHHPERVAMLTSVAAVAVLTVGGTAPHSSPAPPEVAVQAVRPAGGAAHPAPSLTPVPSLTPPPSPAAAVASARPSLRPVPTLSCQVQHSGPDWCVNPSPDPTDRSPVEEVADCVLHGADTSSGFQCRQSPTPEEEP